MPIYRNKAFLCVIVVVIVVAAGVAYGFSETTKALDNVSIVSANSTAFVYANITLANWTGQSCIPIGVERVEAVLPVNIYDSVLNFTNQHTMVEEAWACAGAFEAAAAAGGTYGGYPTYPTPLSSAIPFSISVLGYVVDVNVTLNNRMPIQIQSIAATSQGEALPTNFVKTSCNPNCSFDANVTLSPVTGPTSVTLTVHADAYFGMIQKTMVASLEFMPSSNSGPVYLPPPTLS